MNGSKFLHRLLILLPVCASLFACSGMLSSDKPAEKTFWLEPWEGRQVSVANAELPGLSLAFSVVPGLDSDRFLTLSPQSELSHFAAARWPDHLPEFGASLLRRSLQNSGLFSVVSMANAGAPGDCELVLEAQEFHTNISGSGQALSVRMSLAGSFGCDNAGGPVAVDASVPVTGSGLAAIAAAHQQAFDGLVRSLTGQLEARIAAVDTP